MNRQSVTASRAVVQRVRPSALVRPVTVPILHPLPLDLDHLEALLADAGHTLMALAVRGTRPAGYRTFWPAIVQEVMEAYGYTPEDMPIDPPSARAIDRMMEAYAWLDAIPLDPPRRGEAELYSRHGGAVIRRVIGLRSLIGPRTGRHVFSWKRLGEALGCSPEGARRWHAQGLERILTALHRAAAPPPGLRVTPMHAAA